MQKAMPSFWIRSGSRPPRRYVLAHRSSCARVTWSGGRTASINLGAVIRLDAYHAAADVGQKYLRHRIHISRALALEWA